MKKLTLDGTGWKNREDLYEYLHKKIDLKQDNLDEVYRYFAELTEDTMVTIVNAGMVKQYLGNYGGSLMKMLEKAGQKNPHVKIRIVYKTGEKKFPKNKEEKKSGCPYAGKCGGCSGQKKSYQEETRRKQKWVESQLGKLTNVDDMITMQQPYHYRHKVHAVYSADRRGRIIAGSYEENTHRVVNVEKCMIEDERAGAIINTIRDLMTSFRIRPFDEDQGTGILRHVLIRCGYATNQILVVIVTSEAVFPAKKRFVKELVHRHPEITSIVQNVNGKKTSAVLGSSENIWYGRGYIEDQLCGKVFRISPKSFYQVNPEQTEILYRTAIDAAELTGWEWVIDAYCGIGTIGIIAAEQAGKVIGVELNKDAVKDAVVNAKMNHVENIRFYQGDAGKFMVEMAEMGQHADVVFMDPPRSGSSEEFLSSVVKLAPQKVVYISCNPETMKDDLIYLMKYQYQIRSCKPIDLFPWTKHVETIVALHRIDM